MGEGWRCTVEQDRCNDQRQQSDATGAGSSSCMRVGTGHGGLHERIMPDSSQAGGRDGVRWGGSADWRPRRG